MLEGLNHIDILISAHTSGVLPLEPGAQNAPLNGCLWKGGIIQFLRPINAISSASACWLSQLRKGLRRRPLDGDVIRMAVAAVAIECDDHMRLGAF